MRLKISKRMLVQHGLVLVFYGVLFLILTFPAMLSISTHLFHDDGDGLQMFWNVWWVRTSTVEFGQLPFHTSLLYFPEGVSLLAHSLHPLGGWMTLLWSWGTNPVLAFNLLIVLSFILTGYGMFCLARSLGCRFIPSVGSSIIFSFSNYHFAHTEGHLNLVMMQAIPFFFLFFLKLVRVPSIGYAFVSGVFLALVQLSDYYYFVFCVLAGFVVVLYHFFQTRSILFFTRNWRAWIVFGGATVVLAGPLAIAFLRANAASPFIGGHDPSLFSADLFSLVIPGGHWRFASWTSGFWAPLPGNIHESSIYVGWAALGLAALGVWRNRSNHRLDGGLWLTLGVLFWLMSLGPNLQVWGKAVSFSMPYDALVAVFPMLKTGGVPVRFAVIALLAISVLVANGMETIGQSSRLWKRPLLILIVIVGVVELLPRPLTLTKIHEPAYLETLKQQDPRWGLLDYVNTPYRAMYLQTLHHLPLLNGYIAKVQEQALARRDAIDRLVIAGEYERLVREYSYRYFLTLEDLPYRRLYDDGRVAIYDLSQPIVHLRP